MKSHARSFKNSWYIWLFPVIALAISAWLFAEYLGDQGPRIQISFEDASSIQVEKTKVKFRGVTIGTVKDVYISDDQKDAVAEIVLRKDAEHFAVAGSKFSLVTPKVNFQGITGLETLIEGTYIAVSPGPETGEKKLDFKSQSSLPVDPLDETSVYHIETDNAESISTGDSVTFRGVKVGKVSRLNFIKGAQGVNVQINIENKYTHLIRTNTVFWRKVGIQAKLGLFGSEIKVNSMDSIMNGGIEFSTPTQAATRAKAAEKFKLVPAAPKEAAKWNPVLD